MLFNYSALSDEAKAELACVAVEAVTLVIVLISIAAHACSCLAYWRLTGTFPEREEFFRRVDHLRGRRRERIASLSPVRLDAMTFAEPSEPLDIPVPPNTPK